MKLVGKWSVSGLRLQNVDVLFHAQSFIDVASAKMVKGDNISDGEGTRGN